MGWLPGPTHPLYHKGLLLICNIKSCCRVFFQSPYRKVSATQTYIRVSKGDPWGASRGLCIQHEGTRIVMAFLLGCFALFHFLRKTIWTPKNGAHMQIVLHTMSATRDLELSCRDSRSGLRPPPPRGPFTDAVNLTRGSCTWHLVSWSFPPAVTCLAPREGSVCAVRRSEVHVVLCPASPSYQCREVLSEGRAASVLLPLDNQHLPFGFWGCRWVQFSLGVFAATRCYRELGLHFIAFILCICLIANRGKLMWKENSLSHWSLFFLCYIFFLGF